MLLNKVQAHSIVSEKGGGGTLIKKILTSKKYHFQNHGIPNTGWGGG